MTDQLSPEMRDKITAKAQELFSDLGKLLRFENYLNSFIVKDEGKCECGKEMQIMAYGLDGMYRKKFCPNCPPQKDK